MGDLYNLQINRSRQKIGDIIRVSGSYMWFDIKEICLYNDITIDNGISLLYHSWIFVNGRCYKLYVDIWQNTMIVKYVDPKNPGVFARIFNYSFKENEEFSRELLIKKILESLTYDIEYTILFYDY